MSANQAMSRKKAAAANLTKDTPQFEQSFGSSANQESKEVTVNQLILQHDYKLLIFENKLKELHERTISLTKGKNNSDNELAGINENMLTEALQAMDQRLDNLEIGLTDLSKTSLSSGSSTLLTRVEKIENEQTELKALLLKIQGLAMETQMRMIQLRGNETISTNGTTSQTLTNTTLNMDNEKSNEEENLKKSKKIINK